jgi:hypothetical protein
MGPGLRSMLRVFRWCLGVPAEAGPGTALIATNSGSEAATLDAYTTADPSGGIEVFPVISASGPGEHVLWTIAEASPALVRNQRQ